MERQQRQDALIADINQYATRRFEEYVRNAPLLEVLNLAEVERLALAVTRALLVALVGAWKAVIEDFAVPIARECPGCGGHRKCRFRRDDPMKLSGWDSRLR